LLEDYKFPIILITHQPQLKVMIREHIIKILNYYPIDQNNLSFKIVDPNDVKCFDDNDFPK